MRDKPLFFTAGVCAMLLAGCKSSMAGTYSDANGAVILELRGGGSANFTFMGDVEDCSYKSGGRQLTLTCKGSPVPTTVFAIHDDGSLTVRLESGGKAIVSSGPVSHACSYSESGKSVSLVCDDNATNFTIQDDGALVGPPQGLMTRLTPLEN